VIRNCVRFGVKLKRLNNIFLLQHDRADNSDKADVITRVQKVFVDSPKSNVSKNGKQQKTKQTAYLLVKTMRQRNKRYISCK
jgi:hypothetical protein